MLLWKDFCLALAQNRSLRVLDVEGFNTNCIGGAIELGRAIAVNAFLGNSLKELNMK